MGMMFKTALVAVGVLFAAQAAAQVTFYEREDFRGDRYAQNDQYRRHDGERTFEAPVTAVRAVVGPPEQRCWVERQEIEQRGAPNVGGAIAGAVIGGVLGHQIGSGRGRDVATAG